MDFVEQLNQWGHEKKPFVFLIDFEQKKPLAWLINDCPDRFQFKFTKASSLNKTIKNATEKDHFFSEINDSDFINSKMNLMSDNLLTKHPIKITAYQNKYNQVMDALHKGDSFLMNLTIPTNQKMQFLR